MKIPTIKKIIIGIIILATTIGIGIYLFIQSIAIPNSEEIGLKYKTTQAIAIPEKIEWQSVGFAKELINQKESMVVIAAGNNPISDKDWKSFSPRFPWAKNIDRNILFQKTHFIRSPYAPADCQGKDCKSIIEYKKHTWMDIAQPIAVDYIPDKTNILQPEPGHLVIKTILKCKFMQFENEIYQLTDNQENFYVMHATETGEPKLDVTLPNGWTLQKVSLEEPLILAPFGSSGECYYNVVGDHVGQGYHQYVYSSDYYPN